MQQDSVVATDIVEYRCTTTGASEPQDIKVKVELTMPTGAATGEQMTIGWLGTYADGTELRAPATGLASGTKLYAYASISGITRLTSATGVGALDTVSAGQVIPLPAAPISLKTTSSNAGTATVGPAAMNFGTSPTAPSIECEVQNAANLMTYTLTIVAGDQTSSPTPETTSPRPTHTVTATVTKTPTNENGKVTRIPAGGAATGGGGETGPDGRTFVLTGFLLILAAIAGLLLRRRSLPRG